MTPYKTFRVVANLPEPLLPLREIAYNLWLAWNPQAIKLFITIDDELWERCLHNPVKMLGEISQKRLAELTQDEGFRIELEKVHEGLKQYLGVSKGLDPECRARIAFFSAEFGLNDTLPIYSGGLGILSGDYVKSCSDLNLDFVGVGILYRHGYFQQYLNQDGWQQDFYQINDFSSMQVREVVGEDGLPQTVSIPLPGRELVLKIWRIQVGRVSIYLLDANDERNSAGDRQLTAQLYGGDREVRLQQEMILGIGGIRMLQKLGIDVNVLHMNEGHSAFAPFARIRLLMEKLRIPFGEAFEVVRKSSIFTTHTNVEAGHDSFDPDLIKKYLSDYVRELNLPLEQFLAFGRPVGNNPADSFSMTLAAIRASSFVNGVSKLQADVSRKMWRGIWGEIPLDHVPIASITNGVHIPSYISFELNGLYERYLGNKWREKEDYKEAWEKVLNIPDSELWSVKELRRRRLIAFTRQRLQKQLVARGATRHMIDDSQEVLNPDMLTIGFARRFVTYKRSHLIFKDPERLLKILNHPERPVQMIIAGKAHPQDQAGKTLIKDLIHFIAANQLRKRVVFIEDYDFNVARYLVQGVDVWLNTPRRPLEACGTSGMKAACNGVLNLSVLDGWWDEAYDFQNGWAIGNRETYQDQEYQDEVESKALYSILENDVVPLFYNRGSDELPREWIKMVKHSLITIASRYNTNRMVKEYYYRFYKRAADHYEQLLESGGKERKDFLDWKERLQRDFSGIRIRRVSVDSLRQYKIGEEIPITVEADLGKIRPEEIAVDVYYGLIGEGDELHNSQEVRLEAVEPLPGNLYRFSGIIPTKHTGSFGFRIRVTPFHDFMANPYELNLALWD